MKDKLEEIFSLQKGLTEMMNLDRYPDDIEGRISALCTAMIHEAIELQRTTNWKWWKKPMEFNLIKCAKKIMGWGAKYVIIKKGEHGSLLFYEDVVFASAAFSLEKIVDPTGAGDSFAGAMMGYLASKNKTDLATIKKSVVYGNVMGSFAVEGYGPEVLLRIKKSDIKKRITQYEKMTRF